MKTVFIADAHLAHPDNPNYRALLAFLAGLQGTTDRLVLLGDLFAFWAGFGDGDYPPYRPVLEALQGLHAGGVEIVYVEGNHDFHLERYFGRQLGWRVLPDGGRIDVDGHCLFVAHGDLVNPDDRPYLRLRRVFRSRPFRWLCQAIPPSLMAHIANWAIRQSEQRRPPKPADSRLVAMLERYAADKFTEGADAVIVGHLHQPLRHVTPAGQILVLGDWITQFSYAVFDQGRLELREYPPPLPESAAAGPGHAG